MVAAQTYRPKRSCGPKTKVNGWIRYLHFPPRTEASDALPNIKSTESLVAARLDPLLRGCGIKRGKDGVNHFITSNWKVGAMRRTISDWARPDSRRTRSLQSCCITRS